MAWNLSALFRPTPEGRHHPRRAAFRPALEALEGRCLPSFNVGFSVIPDTTYTSTFVTLSGNVTGPDGMSFPLQEQAPGSLTTTYEGTINATLADDESSIQFVSGGTNVTADINGQWRPDSQRPPQDNSEDADYGSLVNLYGVVNAFGAIRHLALTMSSDPLAMPDGSTFNSSQMLQTTSGEGDVLAAGIGSGNADLSNLSTTNIAPAGTFTDNGDGTFALVAPVHYTLNGLNLGQGFTLNLTADGVLSAAGVVSPAPPGAVGHGHDAQAFLVGSQALTGTAAPATAPAPLSTGLTNVLDGNPLALRLDPAVSGLTAPAALSQGVSRTGTDGHPLTTTGAVDHAIQLVVSDGLHNGLVTDLTAPAPAPA
jgi:hypothetical protein